VNIIERSSAIPIFNNGVADSVIKRVATTIIEIIMVCGKIKSLLLLLVFEQAIELFK